MGYFYRLLATVDIGLKDRGGGRSRKAISEQVYLNAAC